MPGRTAGVRLMGVNGHGARESRSCRLLFGKLSACASGYAPDAFLPSSLDDQDLQVVDVWAHARHRNITMAPRRRSTLTRKAKADKSVLQRKIKVVTEQNVM